MPTQHGYLSAQLGIAPREAFVRGEAGYKITQNLGAFAYGEKRVTYGDPWATNWDAGVGVKWSF